MDELISINDMLDSEIAERMRGINYAKFKTLVRMHLSFELDLNTDEFDLPCHEVVYYEKGKVKKWNRPSKRQKATTCSSSSGKSSTGNSPTEGSCFHIDAGFIFHLDRLKNFLLMEKNIIQEGIFRKAGSVSRQNELRLLIQNEKDIDFESKGLSAHDCATVFKGYLAELPEPVLTDAHYPAHLQIAPLCVGASHSSRMNTDRKKRDQHLLSSIQLLLLLLPDDNRMLMKHIIEMLHAISQREESNKMSAQNLAILFAPHLICPRNLPPEALQYVAQTMSSIINYMITRGMEIFEIPAKLATDIRAYFLERKRKKTMSPEQTLDESMSDMSTVNTVYTFVDREKTAAAHTANNTDTELAQLYAHIQSLPESSNKRRLIKQFNKQNGQGTPLQLVLKNRLKNLDACRGSKSITDSIKKHIFHKGIMSRTPKRGTTDTAKVSKFRVLFQSPVSGSNCSESPTFYTPLSTPSNVASHQNNSFHIKNHSLKKSISSSSLLLTPSSSLVLKTKATLGRNYHRLDESNSNDSESLASTSILAPVSRATSNDFIERDSCAIDMNCKLVVADADDKNFTEQNDDDDNEDEDDDLSSNTQLQNDMKSRYKSEPNLSRMIEDNFNTKPVDKGKSFARKLIKGVSMGNLKFSFGTPESTTKRCLVRKFSLLKRSSSGDYTDSLQKERIDEEQSQHGGDENEKNLSQIVGDKSSHSYLNLLTSTPSTLIGQRKSMSPITKSTQRMPKAMQESIMTPRSRKPVMMLTTTTGSTETNQTAYQSDLLSFREQDEESPTKLIEYNENGITTVKSDALTSNFKEYLLSRSVLTASPVDSSFSSQPDDFGSTQDIEELNTSPMSDSLLYCLDGNQPENNDKQQLESMTPTNSFIISNSRKRFADDNNVMGIENKENYDNVDGYLMPKKLLITEYPGETSF